MENAQGIAWENAFPEANHITVIIVFRGLDQYDLDPLDLSPIRHRHESASPRACSLAVHLL
jgi:hypothetical protein